MKRVLSFRRKPESKGAFKWIPAFAGMTACVLLLCFAPAHAQTAQNAAPAVQKQKPALKLPRFLSLRGQETSVRTGPGKRYPVKWVLLQQGMPVEVVQEYDTWRKIRDVDGQDGWVHQSLLTVRRNAIVTGKQTQTMRKKPKEDSGVAATVDGGVQVHLIACEDAWCKVSAESYKGFLPKKSLWGVYADERFD